MGDYTLADGMLHAYLLNSGEFSSIDFPDAAGTSSGGINPSGDIVGLYVSAGLTHGFLRTGDSFTAIDFPGAIFGPPPLSLPPATLALGINSRGDIMGGYRSAGVIHAFLLSDGEFTSFDFPDATFSGANAINPRGDLIADRESFNNRRTTS